MIPKFNPDNYLKLFNIKESLFICYYEIKERMKMHEDGFPNMDLIYLKEQWFLSKNDLDKYDLDDERILSTIRLIEDRVKEFLEFSKIGLKDHSASSWEEMMKIFKKFMEVWGRCLRVVDIIVYCSSYFEKKVLQMVRDNGLSEREFDILTHPLYNTYHQRRHRDLILIKMGKLSKDDFIRKWAFSRMLIFQYNPLDDAFIDEQLSEIKDPEKELKEIEKKHKDAEKAYNKLYAKLNGELKKKADILQKLLYIRDYRIENIFRATYNLLGFNRALASKLGISYERLIHMLPDEVMEKRIPKDLDQRLKGYVYCRQGLFVGKEADEIDALFNKQIKQDSVTGKGVSLGIVQGTAKVVKSTAELSKIKKGDIIVCDITSPEYLHALQKVSAIVANIGGFTSHSAIVAREFGIPCVVGTGIATNVFKDGDKIEVDANKGIVRRLK